MAGTLTTEASGLRVLLERLMPYRVTRWVDSASHDPGDRVPAASLAEANVISSGLLARPGMHQIVLDIDHPAWLVKSSTPGHYHLYIEVPGGVPWSRYTALLANLARCGVIEEGYLNASLSRGYTAVRLPWVKKPLAERAAEARGAAVVAAGRFLSGLRAPESTESLPHTYIVDADEAGPHIPGITFDEFAGFPSAAAQQMMAEQALAAFTNTAAHHAATMFTEVDEDGEDI